MVTVARYVHTRTCMYTLYELFSFFLLVSSLVSAGSHEAVSLWKEGEAGVMQLRVSLRVTVL